MAFAGGIEHPHRAIALRSTLLRVEWVIGGTTQRSIWLQSEIGSGKSFGARIGVPIEQAHRRQTHLLSPAHWPSPAHSLSPAHHSENRPVLSNAWEKQTRAGRTPSADSRPIARGFARTLAHRAYEKPSDRDLVPDLHRRVRFRRSLDASTDQVRRRE